MWFFPDRWACRPFVLTGAAFDHDAPLDSSISCMASWEQMCCFGGWWSSCLTRHTENAPALTAVKVSKYPVSIRWASGEMQPQNGAAVNVGRCPRNPRRGKHFPFSTTFWPPFLFPKRRIIFKKRMEKKMPPTPGHTITYSPRGGPRMVLRWSFDLTVKTLVVAPSVGRKKCYFRCSLELNK